MIVPPELAYGDYGTGKLKILLVLKISKWRSIISGDVIPPKATLTFLVRLVQINDNWWTEETEAKKVLAWKTEFRPEPCEVMAGYNDNIYIHYRATR